MTKCKLCQTKIVPFFSLGKIPLVNSFLLEKELANEKKYDLSIGFCPKCYLVQLMKTVSPKKLFSHYIYLTGNSKTMVDHCEKTAKYLSKRFKLNSKSLFLEIASNDGTLLYFFKKLKVGILGVDPAKNIAEIANKKGLTTIPDFFNYKFARKLVTEKKVQADVIFGANVLAHVPKIYDFVKGVKTALKPKGTAIFEFPYLRGLLENKFDTIYQEHVFYYGILALINLFSRAGLEIYDVEITPMQGGSLRIYAANPGTYQQTTALKKLIQQEKELGYDKIAIYKKMNLSVEKLKKDLLTLLTKIKKQKKTIAAYSAPAKGVIALNYFKIGKKYLDFIVDKAKEKQGLYVPGIYLKVEPPNKIFERKPDYVFILCWNIKEEIINQLKEYRQQGGKFIITIPKLEVI